MRLRNVRCIFYLSVFLLIDAGGVMQAQSYLSPGYIFGEIRQSMGFYTVPDAPDFVVKARPSSDSLQYAPLKPPPRDFHHPASKPASQLEEKASTIAELEAARARVKSQASKTLSGEKTVKTSTEKDPAPMTWNPWDTE